MINAVCPKPNAYLHQTAFPFDPFSINAYRDTESWGRRLANGVHFHVEAGEESAGDVEGCVAIGLVALDAGANATLFAYSAKLKPELR